MVINVLNVVSACNTAAEGALVAVEVRRILRDGGHVNLSFSGVTHTPSSFINASIVSLVFDDPPADLRERLVISNLTDQIADMITRCLRNRGKSAAATTD